MYSRMMLTLDDEEREALSSLAQVEVRGMKEQARFIIRTELQKRGFLNMDSKSPTTTVQSKEVN